MVSMETQHVGYWWREQRQNHSFLELLHWRMHGHHRYQGTGQSALWLLMQCYLSNRERPLNKCRSLAQVAVNSSIDNLMEYVGIITQVTVYSFIDNLMECVGIKARSQIRGERSALNFLC